MRIIIAIIAFSAIFLVTFSQTCTLAEQIAEFTNKTLLNSYPEFTQNPYENLTTEQKAQINSTIHNKSLVCALQYQDASNKTYLLNTFSTKEQALLNNYIVTHQGACAACSTLYDLVAYLKQNLTAPARKCGAFGFFSKKWSLNCLIGIGFTNSCAEIWYYNTVNTREKCLKVCMWSWITNEPNVKENGELNDCLQCDEDESGPVFKYYSGRTRRNSGIRSEIDRPADEIYNITHCYF